MVFHRGTDLFPKAWTGFTLVHIPFWGRLPTEVSVYWLIGSLSRDSAQDPGLERRGKIPSRSENSRSGDRRRRERSPGKIRGGKGRKADPGGNDRGLRGAKPVRDREAPTL